MQLYQHQAIVLLGLDDEQGHFDSGTATYLNYGFAAALIIDLLLAERIELEDGKIRVKTNALTRNKALDNVLSRMYRVKSPKSVSHWVHAIVMDCAKLWKQTLNELIQQGILRHKTKKFLWVFKLNRYPTVDSRAEDKLRARLRELLFQSESPDKDERMLLSILLHCELYTLIAKGKEERKQAKARLKALTEEEEMGKHFSQAIQEAQAAVFVAMTA